MVGGTVSEYEDVNSWENFKTVTANDARKIYYSQDEKTYSVLSVNGQSPLVFRIRLAIGSADCDDFVAKFKETASNIT